MWELILSIKPAITPALPATSFFYIDSSKAIGSIRAYGLRDMVIVHATQPCPALSPIQNLHHIGQNNILTYGIYCPPIQKGFTG